MRSVSTGHSVSVGADGVTVQTPRGKINVSWSGATTLTIINGPVHFSAAVGPDSWKIDLSIPLASSTPRLDKIQEPLGKINASLKGYSLILQTPRISREGTEHNKESARFES